MDNRPICFFDSGIGGSTILKEVMKLLPNENYIYYADSINNPYGQKTKEKLFDVVDSVVKKLLKFDPKVIVCACNTATEMVLNDIREKYPNTLFVGTEPAVKIVYDKYPDKKSIVMTTKGTHDSERFQKLFEKYKTVDSTLIEANELAGLIENGEDAFPYLNSLLKDYKGNEIVVLGCTHFPLVKDEIKKILGPVTFIDGGIGIAKRIDSLIEKNEGSGSLKIIETSLKVEDKIKDIVNS